MEFLHFVVFAREGQSINMDNGDIVRPGRDANGDKPPKDYCEADGCPGNIPPQRKLIPCSCLVSSLLPELASCISFCISKDRTRGLCKFHEAPSITVELIGELFPLASLVSREDVPRADESSFLWCHC